MNIPGLSFESDGRIHGTPLSNGTYRIQFTASKDGWLSSSVYLILTIKAKPSSQPDPPSIITGPGDLASGKFGTQYKNSPV